MAPNGSLGQFQRNACQNQNCKDPTLLCAAAFDHRHHFSERTVLFTFAISYSSVNDAFTPDNAAQNQQSISANRNGFLFAHAGLVAAWTPGPADRSCAESETEFQCSQVGGAILQFARTGVPRMGTIGSGWFFRTPKSLQTSFPLFCLLTHPLQERPSELWRQLTSPI